MAASYGKIKAVLFDVSTVVTDIVASAHPSGLDGRALD
jgi:hypothetical protein